MNPKTKTNNWTMTKGLPSFKDDVMKWGGSRPYNTKLMSLKLGEDNMKMHFEFFSKAGQK